MQIYINSTLISAWKNWTAVVPNSTRSPIFKALSVKFFLTIFENILVVPSLLPPLELVRVFSSKFLFFLEKIY